MPHAALNHARPGAALDRASRSLVARAALWQPSTAAFVATVVFLVGHEVLYHLSDGTDYPLVLLTIDGQQILPVSHGGLDVIGAGLLIVFLLLLIEWARQRERRPR